QRRSFWHRRRGRVGICVCGIAPTPACRGCFSHYSSRKRRSVCESSWRRRSHGDRTGGDSRNRSFAYWRARRCLPSEWRSGPRSSAASRCPTSARRSPRRLWSSPGNGRSIAWCPLTARSRIFALSKEQIIRCSLAPGISGPSLDPPRLALSYARSWTAARRLHVMISTMRLREIAGPAGRLEALLDESAHTVAGVRAAVVFAHPHPQYGGTMHTKVVYQAAKALSRIGCSVLRFNFRGVGASVGSFDDGVG